jgi:hypothetical protein
MPRAGVGWLGEAEGRQAGERAAAGDQESTAGQFKRSPRHFSGHR